MTAPVIDHGTDRRITIVLALCAVVAVLVILGTPAVINASSTVDEVERGNELTGCRSAYSSTVTDKRTEFDIARSHRDTADTVVDITVLDLAQAAIFGDRARVRELEGQLPALRTKVAEANEVVIEADAALIKANEDYQAAVELSRSDPDRFIAACERGDK